MDTVRDAAEKVYEKGEEAPDEYATLRKERMQLLRRRATLRTTQRDKPSAEVAAIGSALAVVSRQLRLMRKAAATQKTERLIEELWQSWRTRDFSNVHKLRRELAGTERGLKKRCYRVPVARGPSARDWE